MNLALTLSPITATVEPPRPRGEGRQEDVIVLEEDWDIPPRGMVARSNVDVAMCIIMKAHASCEALGEVWEGKMMVVSVPPHLDSFPLTSPYGEHLGLTREEEEERVRVREECSCVQRCYVPHC